MLNDEGYYTFPEHFRGFSSGSGKELDGTANIVIGLVRLWQRIDNTHPVKAEIEHFLSCPQSPVWYIIKKLQVTPFIEGTGEFGGGWGVDGEWYNTMQNAMLRQMMLACAEFFESVHEPNLSAELKGCSERLFKNMLELMKDENTGGWTWTLDPKTLHPDEEALNGQFVHGTAAINGIGAVYAYAEGLEMRLWEGYDRTLKTLKASFAMPNRKQLFEKYGMCAFVESDRPEFLPSNASWLSYCDCYAMQTMLLCDKYEFLDRMFSWITASTYMDGSADEDFIHAVAQGTAEVDFTAPPRTFWFQERNFAPDYTGIRDIGCGKLNLVNVAEPMKLARLMIGIDDSNNIVKLIPRLPDFWDSFEAKHWAVNTPDGPVYVNISYHKKIGGTCSVALEIEEGKILEHIVVRFQSGIKKEFYNLSGNNSFNETT